MKLVIDGEPHEFDIAKLTFGEAGRLEAAFGGTINELGEALKRGSMSAFKLVIWTVLRRKSPALRVNDVDDLTPSQIEVVPDAPAEEVPTGAAPALDSPSAA